MSRSVYDAVINVDTRSAVRNLDDVSKSVSGLTASFNLLQAGVAAAFSGAVISRLASGFTQVYTEYERFRTILSTTLGSQAAANAELRRLQVLANELPQDLQDITKAFVTMSRFGLDTTNDGLRAFSNIATASGRSMDDLANALANAMTGQFQSLRGFGIKVRKEGDDIVANFGSQQIAVVRTNEQLVAALQELGSTRFGAAADENANTLSQSLSNLSGAVYEATIAFMEGLAPALKLNVDNMAEFIRANNQLITQMGMGVGDALRVTAAGARLISENIDLIRNAIISLTVVQGLTAFTNLFRNVSRDVAKFGGTAKLLQGLTAAISTMGAKFLAAAAPIAAAVAVVTALTVALTLLQDETVKVGDTTTTYGEIARAVFQDIIGVIMSFVNNTGRVLVALWTNSADDVKGFSRFVVLTLQNMGKMIAGSINALITTFAMLFTSARNVGAAIALSFKGGLTMAGFLISDFVSRAAAHFKNLWDFISSAGAVSLVNAFDGFGRGVIEQMNVELKKVGDQMLDPSVFIGRDFVGEAIAPAFDAITNYLESAVQRSRAASREIVTVDDVVTQTITQNAATVTAAVVDVKKVFDDLRKSFRDIRSLDEYIEAFEKVVSLSKIYGEQHDEVVRSFDALRNSLRSARDEFNNISSIDEYINTLARWRAAQADGIITNRELGDSLNDLAREFRNLVEPFSELNDIDEFNAAFTYFNTLLDTGKIGLVEYQTALNELARGFDSIDFGLTSAIPTLAEYDAQLRILENTLSAGKISLAQFLEAKKELDDSFLASEGLGRFISQLGSAQAALSEDLADALLKGENLMKSFGNFMKKIISQIIADIIRLSIIQPILSSIFGGFGFVPNFGTGGSIQSIGRRAVGGPVIKDKPYVVGERGAELFVPTGGGSIVPNDKLGGGVTTVTYNIQAVDARSFQQLLSSQPELIYSLSQTGSRRLPR